MDIKQILTPSRTFAGLHCSSKKRCLERISQLVAGQFDYLDSQTLFTALLNREKLGNTSLGHGIAIPHCRLPGCKQVVGVLVKLEQGIDYDAIDKIKVDLLFVLLVSTDATSEHLQVLSMLAENFSRAEYRQGLRNAQNHQQLYQAAVVGSVVG